MPNQLENLHDEIERLKLKLNELSETKEPDHSQVIEISQKIDVLTDEYDRMKKESL